VAGQAALLRARAALADAPEFIARQERLDAVLAAQRVCTRAVHSWIADTLQLEMVKEPTKLLSLDVDGVLEDEAEGFSATGLVGGAALRLLQLGHVAVLLNTARSLHDVCDRVEQFALLGGVGAFGGVTWNGVFSTGKNFVSDRAQHQMERLRFMLRAQPNVVLHRGCEHLVRVSRLVNGGLLPLHGTEARSLLDRTNLTDLGFWVAPSYTDFVDRRVDKGTGITLLREELGLHQLPLASVGDATCDLPMLRLAEWAFLPAATLPSYARRRGQRLVRSRHLGEQALWDVACHLVPNLARQQQVMAAATAANPPQWFPRSLSRHPANSSLVPRLASTWASLRRLN
jgi:3-deoxy-D-manno-octulosonate 8-phosphate phosphatase KdsC-like HAD superfamily phosphatase